MSVRGLGLVFVGYGLLVMPACIFGNGGSDTDTPEGTDVDGTDVDGTDGEGSDVTGNEPPRILDYSVDTFTATDDEQLRFTAVVTDPDGIDDVAHTVVEGFQRGVGIVIQIRRQVCWAKGDTVETRTG